MKLIKSKLAMKILKLRWMTHFKLNDNSNYIESKFHITSICQTRTFITWRTLQENRISPSHVNNSLLQLNKNQTEILNVKCYYVIGILQPNHQTLHQTPRPPSYYPI